MIGPIFKMGFDEIATAKEKYILPGHTHTHTHILVYTFERGPS